MTEWVEQQICIKFCIKLEHLSMETIQMIQKAFEDDAMSTVQIKVWHKHFKDGQVPVESDPCSRSPARSRTPENVEHVQAAINKDQWLTVQELEADLGILKTTVSKILTQDLGGKHVEAKFILWLLLLEQKEHCAAVGTTVRSQSAYFEGDQDMIVLCTMFLVSSSINASIFITWLETFWTNLVCVRVCVCARACARVCLYFWAFSFNLRICKT